MLMDFDSFDREQERLKQEQEALEREQAKLKQSSGYSTSSSSLSSVYGSDLDSEVAFSPQTTDSTKSIQDSVTSSAIASEQEMQEVTSQYQKRSEPLDNGEATLTQGESLASISKAEQQNDGALSAHSYYQDTKESVARQHQALESLYQNLANTQFDSVYDLQELNAGENAPITEAEVTLAFAFAMRADDYVALKEVKDHLLYKLKSFIQAGNGNGVQRMAKAEFDFVIKSALSLS